MSYQEVTSREQALERIKYLEQESTKLVLSTASLGYVELTRAENRLFAYRKEINSLKARYEVKGKR